jgi:hypothetical protein
MHIAAQRSDQVISDQALTPAARGLLVKGGPMSTPQRLRLVGSERERSRLHARVAERLQAHEKRLALEHENTTAALVFLRPFEATLFTETDAGWLTLLHICTRFEDEIYAYVTGNTAEEGA